MKHNLKKTIALIMAIVLLCTMMPASLASAETELPEYYDQIPDEGNDGNAGNGGAAYSPIVEIDEDFSGYALDTQLATDPENGSYSLIGGDGTSQVVVEEDYYGDVITLRSSEKGRVGIKLQDDDVFSESEVWLDVKFNDIDGGDRQMEHFWDEFLVNTFWLDPSYGASVVLSDYTNQVTTKAWGTNTTTVAIDEEEGFGSKIVPDKWYSLRIRTFNRDGASSLNGNRDTNQTKIEFSFWDADKSEPSFPMAARLVWFAHFNYDAGIHHGNPAVKAPLLIQNYIYTRYPDGGNTTLRNPTPAVWDSRDIHFRKTAPGSDTGAKGSAASNASLHCGSIALYVDLFSDESQAEISIRNLRFTTNSAIEKYRSFDIKTDNIWDYFEPFNGMYNLNNGPNIWNNYGPKTEVTAENFYGIYNEWNQGYNKKVTEEGDLDPDFVGEGKNAEIDPATKKRMLQLGATAGTTSGVAFNTDEYQNSILDLMVRFDADNAMAGDDAGLYIAPVGDEGIGQDAALALIRPHLSAINQLNARSIKNGTAAESGNNFAVTAGTWYHVRVVTMESGSTGYNVLGDANNYIRIKIWERGTPEPTSYQINHTYSGVSVPAGNVAIYAAAGTGAASVTIAEVSLKAYANGELPQSSARVSQLRLSDNETHIKNFDPDKFVYWHAEGRKDVSAILVNRGDQVAYTQAAASPGIAYVDVRGLVGGANRYEIRFVASGRAIKSIGIPQVTVRRGLDVSKNILPTTVPITLEDGDKFDAYVVWNHLEFDPNNLDEQTITGMIYPEAQRGVNVRAQDMARLRIAQRPIQAQLFISTTGSDSNDGSFAKPFKTIQKARDYIRTFSLAVGMTGDIIVYLRGGTYSIAEPIEFGVDDSGTNGFSIVYQAYPDERPEVSGGYELDAEWEPVTVNGVSAYKVYLDRNEKLRTLYVNGVKANWPTMNIQAQYQVGKMEVTGEEFWAETPGWAWTHILINKSTVPESNFRNGKFINPDDVELWTQAAAWTANHTTLHDITPYETTFDATERSRFEKMWTIPQDSTNYYALEVQQPYGAILSRLTCYCNSRAVNENTGSRRNLNVRNIFSAFGTSRGQYYFDKEMKTLYYYPRAGEDMSTASVIIPQSEGIIKIVGIDKENRVENLTFSGIKFSYDDYLLQRVDGGDPEKEAILMRDFGYVSRAWGGIQSIALQQTFRQEGSHHPAWYNNCETPVPSVAVQSAKNILFEGNFFTNLSSSSNIGFVNDVSDSGIIGNIFKDTAGNAVALGHPEHVFEGVDPLSDNQDFEADNVEAVTRNNKIMYNYIRNIGVDFDQGDAIMAFFVENTDICSNDVENVPYTALCLGWGWWNFEGSTYSFTPGNPSLTAKNNRVLFNRFGDTNIVHTGDGGTLYTLGYQPDTFIAYNYLFRGRAMLYQDEGSTGLYIDSNVVQSGRGSGGSNWGNGLMTNDTVGREIFIRTNTYAIAEGAAALEANAAAKAIADNAGLRAPFDSVFALMEISVNKNVLKNMIDEAESLQESDFAAGSWADLVAELTAAKVLYVDTDAIQVQVDAAASALRSAIDALEAVSTPDAKEVVGIMSIAANGVSVREETTELYIRFSQEVAGLKPADFAVTGATLMDVEANGLFCTLTISDITVPDKGTVSVSISSGNYLFTPMGKEVSVYRYTVRTAVYDLNGGSGETPASVTDFAGDPFTVASADGLIPPSDDKLFKEWNTEADGTGTGYAPGDTALMPGEDTTLYAIWDDACTVIFGVAGENGSVMAEVDGKTVESGDRLVKDTTVVFTAVPDKGYKLKAWTWNGLPVANTKRTYTLTLTGDAAVTVAFEESDYSIPEEGLDLWLTAEEGVTAEANGNVTSWENQAPASTVKLTPSNGTPKLMHDDYNGYDYINFASNDQMSGAFKNYNGSAGMTIVAVNLPATTGLNIGSNWADRSNLLRMGNIGFVSTRRGTVVSFSGYSSQTYALYDLGSDSIGQLTTMIGVRSAGTDRIYFDGQLRSTVTGKSATISNSGGSASTLVLGGAQAGTPYFSGRIAEILIYNRALTNDEILEIQAYVDLKYGLDSVDKSKLKELVKEAEELRASEYTADGWVALQAKMAQAQALLTDSQVTQKNVDDMADVLKAAMISLILKTPKALGIDDDFFWNQAPTLNVDRVVQNNAATLATGKANVLWDDDTLYVRILVIDPVIDGSNSAAYLRDSVEVYLSEQAIRGSYNASNGNQYRVTFDNDYSYKNNTETATNVKHAAKLVNDGYVVFMAIPLTANPVPNKIFTFDIQINDATGGNRTGQATWKDPAANGYNSANDWGELMLDENSVELPTDKTALAALVQEAQTLKAKDYTVSGWAALQAALNDAKALLERDSLKAEVDNAYRALLIAMKATADAIPMDGLDLWLKADAGVSLGDNNRVIGWENQADGEFAGLTLTVPVSGPTAPATLQEDTSGYKYLQFSNTGINTSGSQYDDACVLRTDNFKSYTGNSGMTIIAVNLPESTRGVPDWPDQSTLLRIGSATSAQVLFVSSMRGANISFSGDGSNGAYFGGSSTTINTLSTMIAVKNGTSETVYVDGVRGNLLNRNAVIANNTSALSLGGKKGGVLSYVGRVAEVLIYDRTLTAEELEQVQAYINAKYYGADKSELEDLVQSAESLKEEAYPPGSWATLQDALTDAKAVLANADVVQADVDAAYETLLTAISSLEKLTLTVTVTTPTIVEKLAANLRINVAAENLAGHTLTAYLSVDGVIDETTATDITSGTALMKIVAAPAYGADCKVVVKVDGDVQGSFTMTLAAYNPATLWSPALDKDEDGKLLVCFAESISAGKNDFKATVDGKAYACAKSDDSVLRINVDLLSLEIDTKIVISGIKYPDLFPSYSFTFTLSYNK